MEKKHILIADDDRVSREAVGEFLKEEGYEVTLAADGQEVINYVADFQPDLVLTDWDMPRLNGMGVLTQVKQIAPSVPVIIFTAHTDIGAQREAERLGVFGYLNKPLDFEDILTRIERALAAGTQE